MSCPACFSGHVHDGQPLGKELKIHGRDTYVAEPKDGVKVIGTIVMVSDAFGWEFVNSRILADHYASRTNCRVLLPDFMDGRPCPTWILDYVPRILDIYSISNWIWKPWYIIRVLITMTWFYHHNNSIRSEPKVRSFFEAEKEENASLPLGGAGFCWGGYAVFALARDPESPMDVGFTAHPSGLELPKDAERLKKPMSIAAPEHDNRIKEKDRKEIEGAFKKSEDLKWELKVYKDATHGFAVRGELLRETKEQATEAEEQASSWFIERFKEVKL